ncbi:MAG TPA: hypothetical protein VGG57_15235 [Stellaceae bacterium]
MADGGYVASVRSWRRGIAGLSIWRIRLLGTSAGMQPKKNAATPML